MELGQMKSLYTMWDNYLKNWKKEAPNSFKSVKQTANALWPEMEATKGFPAILSGVLTIQMFLFIAAQIIFAFSKQITVLGVQLICLLCMICTVLGLIMVSGVQFGPATGMSITLIMMVQCNQLM